ncbi:uncharacterized protein [Mytilus edulis]|uniref:uncharacterized protein n=1 Tax=Mytilus edulis TaxID=6550 RepID=UPI0039F0285C
MILYLICPLPTQESVIWKIKTFPIVLGKDVKITCYVLTGTCRKNQARQWTGGQGYKLIGLNGHTTDHSKYEMKIHTSDLSFDLTVKNFSVDDAFYEYTCLCGKEQYSDILKLNDTANISMHLNDSIIDNSYFKDNELYLNVTLMIMYHLPNCSLQLNDKTTILKANDYKKGHNKYDVIRYNEIIPLYNVCSITWVVYCIVGDKSFQTNNNVNKYECAIDNDAKLRNLAIGISAAVFTCILVFGLVVYLQRSNCLRRNVNLEGREQHSSATTARQEEDIPMFKDSLL